MTNQLREEDIEIHNQKMSNVFGISQLDIPIYRQMTNASDNSTHTTPLNYMRHSTPNAVGIRKVEQIKEVDQCSELDEEDNQELNKKFNTMKLTSSVQDDFFQLDGGKNNFEFQELEPVNAPINSTENYQISGGNFYNENVNIDSLTEQVNIFYLQFYFISLFSSYPCLLCSTKMETTMRITIFHTIHILALLMVILLIWPSKRDLTVTSW